MSLKLFLQAIFKILLGIVIVGALLFVPAWSFDYWNGWLLMGILFIPMFIVGIIMMFKSPDLLERRLNAKEKESEQKAVILLSAVMFITGFIVAGLNFRFKWIELPNIVVIIASIIFILGYILYAEVMRENKYLSRTIEVSEDQTVVDTGLYGIVRHPMYFATILLFLSIPLVLGSIQAFIIFLIYPFIIGKRIKNEEEVLERDLKGYKEYKEKIRFKMIPFIW